MLKKKKSESKIFYNFNIEDYVPQDHFLRLVSKVISFDFVYDKVKHLYSKTGQPAIDPVVLIKMLLIGYFYDINSERQLVKDINVNLAYRWFINYDIDEKIPHHSTISQTRKRKFSQSDLFQDIFDEVVNQCKEKGLISGESIFTDSTLIKANASMESLKKISLTPKDYFKNLDKEVDNVSEKKETKKKENIQTKPI